MVRLEAESKAAPSRRDAVIFRDGLLIALLACRMMRLRNLTGVEIGQHLKEVGTQYSLTFAGSETKTTALG